MTRAPLAVLVVATLAGGALTVPSSTAAPPLAEQPGVRETRVIGQSVVGRDIVAWHLGEPARRGVPTVVLISTMHGDEPATRGILEALRDAPPIVGIDLWVVPTYNPDGLVRGTRKNAHGIDLNRNFPNDWKDLDGPYESGPGPASEPETKAMMGFLSEVRPSRMLSFHQPLYGVDTDTKLPQFARRVADKLHLPATTLDCGGVCHGTMTGWFNHNFKGGALTVEYAAHPSQHRMRRVAPAQVLSIFGARFDEFTLVP
ncbi:MAG: M14 family zinc carboxypeptidase [Nocardioides sp.]